MTMSPVEVDRKIRQLDNDVQSIYELLSAIQGTQTRHTNRLQEQAEAIDALGTRLDRVEAKLGILDTTVGSLDTKVGGLDAKIDTVLELLRAR